MKDTEKIDGVCMLIKDRIAMLKEIQKKYNPYGSDVAIEELEELLNAIEELEEFSAETDEE
nr:MAG TPA: hypothetical protein [Caudoviricetes sp.]